jgi:hypothetical protein
MQNYKFNLWRPVRDPWATYGDTIGAFWLPIAAYIYGFFWDGPAPQFAVASWGGLYLLNLAFQTWHVAMRSAGGSPRWAATVLAAGAWPYGLFAILWPELTTRAGLMVMFPIIGLSGGAAMWLAEFKGPRGEAPPPSSDKMEKP